MPPHHPKGFRLRRSFVRSPGRTPLRRFFSEYVCVTNRKRTLSFLLLVRKLRISACFTNIPHHPKSFHLRRSFVRSPGCTPLRTFFPSMSVSLIKKRRCYFSFCFAKLRISAYYGNNILWNGFPTTTTTTTVAATAMTTTAVQTRPLMCCENPCLWQSVSLCMNWTQKVQIATNGSTKAESSKFRAMVYYCRGYTSERFFACDSDAIFRKQRDKREIKTRVYDKRQTAEVTTGPRDHDLSSSAVYRLPFLRGRK